MRAAHTCSIGPECGNGTKYSPKRYMQRGVVAWYRLGATLAFPAPSQTIFRRDQPEAHVGGPRSGSELLPRTSRGPCVKVDRGRGCLFGMSMNGIEKLRENEPV